AAGYDGFAIGNHDFDDGLENAQRLVAAFKCPVLCANVTLADGKPIATEPYHIYEVGPLRVGVIGLLMDHLSGVVPAETMAKIRVDDVVEAAKRIVAEIDPQTDVIILLTHQGVDMDKVLARTLGPEVDLIVGGHSHTSLPRPIVANGIPIVQAGCSLDGIGRVTLRVKDDKAVSVEGELISLKADQVAPGPEMKALLDRDGARVKERFGEEIGTLERDWRRNYYGESNLGNFVADALREKWNADFACINSGSLRKNMSAGPITLLDVYEVYPFTNPVVTFELTGEELLGVLRHNAISAVGHDHGILQVSGVTYEYVKEDRDSARIVKATVGGEPIDPERVYKGVSGNFIVSDKAEKYLGYVVKAWADTGTHVRAVVEEAIRRKKTVKANVEGRIGGP
ncbi:MAG: bifunctional UDP-sugar hydrolase/5'-nucleotidase, partial [Planctomycetota bacterium]